MNRLSDRDALFLAEMGVGPLWQLRAAPAAAAAQPAAEPEVEWEPERAPPAVAGAPPPIAPAEEPAAVPAPPARPGPRPLQRVAQSASALEPVPEPPASEAAWDDAALPRDATPEEIAVMDWDRLQLAIAGCRRCTACRDGRAPVPGTGKRTARWLVAAGATTAADEKARVPLAGDPGKLLDNMLAAVDRSRERDVYITNLIKCRPASANGGERAPTADEAAACRPYLERELVLTGADTVLTLGQIAANTLLGRPLAEPLASARGAVHALAMPGPQSASDNPDEPVEPGPAVHLVATLHPGELLRRGGDKAQAWADLCRARAAGARPG